MLYFYIVYFVVVTLLLRLNFSHFAICAYFFSVYKQYGQFYCLKCLNFFYFSKSCACNERKFLQSYFTLRAYRFTRRIVNVYKF